MLQSIYLNPKAYLLLKGKILKGFSKRDRHAFCHHRSLAADCKGHKCNYTFLFSSNLYNIFWLKSKWSIIFKLFLKVKYECKKCNKSRCPEWYILGEYLSSSQQSLPQEFLTKSLLWACASNQETIQQLWRVCMVFGVWPSLGLISALLQIPVILVSYRTTELQFPHVKIETNKSSSFIHFPWELMKQYKKRDEHIAWHIMRLKGLSVNSFL